MKNNILLASMTILTVFLPTNSHALVVSGPDILPDFQFSNPGARSNAMGGAFIGVADDATAAYANPAGLTILSNTETSVEFKNSLYTSHIYLENGQKYEFEHSNFGTSFIGYAAPRGKTAVALYRHELLGLDQKIENVSYTPSITTRLVDTEIEITAVTYGAAFAAKLVDQLSVGFSVGFTTLDYFYRSDYVAATDSSDYGNNSQVNNSTTGEILTGSLMYSPVDSFNIGLVYRYGPEFKTTYSDSVGNTVNNLLNVPDVYGGGVSWRIGNNLTVAADVNRVMYTDLLDEFYYYDSSVAAVKNPWTRNGSQFTVDDVTEYHVGFEYILPFEAAPVALRGGYYARPDHTIYYTETTLSYLTKFKKGEDDKIYSVGFGMVLGENGQVDFAANIGDFVEEFVLSMVYRF